MQQQRKSNRCEGNDIGTIQKSKAPQKNATEHRQRQFDWNAGGESSWRKPREMESGA